MRIVKQVRNAVAGSVLRHVMRKSVKNVMRISKPVRVYVRIAKSVSVELANTNVMSLSVKSAIRRPKLVKAIVVGRIRLVAAGHVVTIANGVLLRRCKSVVAKIEY